MSEFNATSGKAKILFQMTGSIACFKACQLISKLIQTGHSVQVVASSAALQFVGPATLEGLTSRKVVSDLFEGGNVMDHIHLVRWADLIITAPASANFINKIASGVGDDLLTTQFLAHDFKKPYLIAPAMNTAMYLHPITQTSIQKLRSLGIGILETASGVLACGEIGWGRLLDPELILREIQNNLESFSPAPKSIIKTSNQKAVLSSRILVTAGGTSEAIDAVRVISNRSTGATGAQLSDTLIQLGFDLTFVHSKSSMLPTGQCEKLEFESFADLEDVLRRELPLKDYRAVIHAAAVSDFSPTSVSPGKISSEDILQLKFKKNPKLVDHLREIANNQDLKIIAFKLTASKSIEDRENAVKKLFAHSKADLIIQNDVHEIKGSGSLDSHSFQIYKQGNRDQSLNTKLELSAYLGNYLHSFLQEGRSK